MSCNITYKNGKVVEVLDNLGNPSKLYKDAVSKFGEKEGLNIFLASKSNDFIDIFGEVGDKKTLIASNTVDKLSLDKVSRQQLATIQKVVNSMQTKIAKSLNIPLKEYLKRVTFMVTNNQVKDEVNSIIDRQGKTLNGEYLSDFSNSQKTPEILFQSDESKSQIVQLVPSLNKERDAVLIRALGESDTIKTLLQNNSKTTDQQTRTKLNSTQKELQELFKQKHQTQRAKCVTSAM